MSRVTHASCQFPATRIAPPAVGIPCRVTPGVFHRNPRSSVPPASLPTTPTLSPPARPTPRQDYITEVITVPSNSTPTAYSIARSNTALTAITEAYRYHSKLTMHSVTAELVTPFTGSETGVVWACYSIEGTRLSVEDMIRANSTQYLVGQNQGSITESFNSRTDTPGRNLDRATASSGLPGLTFVVSNTSASSRMFRLRIAVRRHMPRSAPAGGPPFVAPTMSASTGPAALSDLGNGIIGIHGPPAVQTRRKADGTYEFSGPSLSWADATINGSPCTATSHPGLRSLFQTQRQDFAGGLRLAVVAL